MSLACVRYEVHTKTLFLMRQHIVRIGIRQVPYNTVVPWHPTKINDVLHSSPISELHELQGLDGTVGGVRVLYVHSSSPGLPSVGLGTPFRPRWRSIFGGGPAAAAPRAPGNPGRLLQLKYRVRAPHAKTGHAAAPSCHLISASLLNHAWRLKGGQRHACRLVNLLSVFCLILSVST